MQCVTLSFFRFGSVASRFWAMWMMGAARLPMARLPGLSFWKLCGSGVGEGFSPTAFPHVFAILCVWDDEETAHRQLDTAPIFTRYRARASETWSVFLSPTSSRGSWSGVAPFDVVQDSHAGPLAALTRATVKPSLALRFWRKVPSISTVIGMDQNVAFKIGIGEVPLLQQVTFSIWPNTEVMAEFARRDGPHARAIKAVRDGQWFREELYARFRVTGTRGTWGGISPLRHLEQRS